MSEFEREPLDVGSFPPNLQKHVKPESPKPMKMMAANGMLPAPPEQMVKILYQLHFEDDGEVQEAVEASVADMPENLLVPAAQGEDHPGVLDWLADMRSDSNDICEVIVRNQNADDLTIVEMATNADAHLGDVIATNQVRVLRTPKIIAKLYKNANVGSATIDSLIELAQRNEVELEDLPGLNLAIEKGEAFTGGDEDDEDFSKLLEKEADKATVEDKKRAKLEDDSLTRSQKEKLAEELADDDDEQEDKKKPLYAKIQDMSVGKKIRLATVGSREAIKILVKDTNKLVHMAAIQSPRINKGDIKKMSSNKSLPDGVIEYIANNRDWTQDYEIRKNLVLNPKTPLKDVLGFLNHLRGNDLREVSRSRNVPHQVSRQAKNLLKKRRGGG